MNSVDTTTSMDQITSLAELIHKIGPVAVILAVFLILFLVIVMTLLKGFMNNQKKLQEQNEQLTQIMITTFENQKKLRDEEDESASIQKKKYDERNMVGIFVELNRTFKMDCKQYAQALSCDRIAIYVFHNGSHSSHGLPFFKTTCVSEWIKPGCGIPTHLMDSNAVPLTVFDDIIDRLYTYGQVIVRNTETNFNDVLENPSNHAIKSTSFFLGKDGAKVAIFAGTYDSFENMCAFVMVEYLSIINPNEVQNSLAIMRQFCTHIRPTLEFCNIGDE